MPLPAPVAAAATRSASTTMLHGRGVMGTSVRETRKAMKPGGGHGREVTAGSDGRGARLGRRTEILRITKIGPVQSAV